MKGKVCVVCGGSSGIGLETCRSLAEQGATVILTGSTLEKAKQVATLLPGEVRGFQLDLTSYRSILNFAKHLTEEYERLDVLLHNAGLVLPKRRENPQGIEATFAVTYLGPFLLTQKLQSLLESGPPTRVINVCSELHRAATLNFQDLQSRKGYNFISAYRRAELAKMLWNQELSRRLSPNQATANSLHPGGVKTNLFRHFRGPMRWLLYLSSHLKISAKKGAQTSLYLATSPDLQNKTGGYYIKQRLVNPAPSVLDEDLASKLWKRSEELLQIWGEAS